MEKLRFTRNKKTFFVWCMLLGTFCFGAFVSAEEIPHYDEVDMEGTPPEFIEKDGEIYELLNFEEEGEKQLVAKRDSLPDQLCAQFIGMAPKEKYIEEKYQNGEWVESYSAVTKWLEVKFANSYTSDSYIHSEQISYNMDGTYHSRIYYRIQVYKGW